MRKFRNATKQVHRAPIDEMTKCVKLLTKLSAKASKNEKATARIIRLAKKYDAVLTRMAYLKLLLNPVGVR